MRLIELPRSVKNALYYTNLSENEPVFTFKSTANGEPFYVLKNTKNRLTVNGKLINPFTRVPTNFEEVRIKYTGKNNENISNLLKRGMNLGRRLNESRREMVNGNVNTPNPLNFQWTLPTHYVSRRRNPTPVRRLANVERKSILEYVNRLRRARNFNRNKKNKNFTKTLRPTPPIVVNNANANRIRKRAQRAHEYATGQRGIFRTTRPQTARRVVNESKFVLNKNGIFLVPKPPSRPVIPKTGTPRSRKLMLAWS